MNIQAEKIELIKYIADIDSENVLKKIKSIVNSYRKGKEVELVPQHLLTNSGMLISESVLTETWKNESDEEWAQYLKA